MRPANTPDFNAGMTRFGREIEVHTQPRLRDGSVMMVGRYLWVGTCPLSPLEALRREARLFIRREYEKTGHMTWLGLRVENEPTGNEVMSALRRGAVHPHQVPSLVKRW